MKLIIKNGFLFGFDIILGIANILLFFLSSDITRYINLIGGLILILFSFTIAAQFKKNKERII